MFYMISFETFSGYHHDGYLEISTETVLLAFYSTMRNVKQAFSHTSLIFKKGKA